jgi:hypothetical protein
MNESDFNSEEIKFIILNFKIIFVAQMFSEEY